MRRSLIALLLLTVLVGTVDADAVHLKNGGTLRGVILKETPSEVILRLKYTTATLSRSEIQSIERDDQPERSEASTSRFLAWEKCLRAAVRQEWIRELFPIPATVIDQGVLRNVPYKSFRSGHYEFNIYGDPENPAGLEVGVYDELVNDASAKANCIRLMTDWLRLPDDRAVVNSLRLTKDRRTVGQLTFEITPPTDADAYGGWWVSVYAEAALDSARASTAELKAITTRLPKNSDSFTAQPSQDESTSSIGSAYDTAGQTNYDPGTYRYARIPGKDVYVRSYSRKDGTYVHAHTRSAPGSRR